MHFGIMKSELFWGFLSEFFKFLAINCSFSIRLGARFRCLSIKKKDLDRIELTCLQEVSIIVRVNMK